MKMMDCIELTVEKECYAKYGVHKGMQGWICLEETIDGTRLINFPQCFNRPDIDTIPVHESDMKQINGMNASINERIKAEHEGIESAPDIMEIIGFIEENLVGETKETAIDFVWFLRAHGCGFYRDTGECWKDKIYYWVKFYDSDKCVAFIAIKDPDEPQNAWTVWSDQSSYYEKDSVSDEIKELGWRYVDRCGMCGGGGACSGGKEKTVFGRKFPRVCSCTFRIDNAKQSDLEFLKQMAMLRIDEIIGRPR